MAPSVIKDVQSGTDTREVAISRVGVCRVKLPFQYEEDGVVYPSVGLWSADTDLPADVRGTHMSRIMRALNDTARSRINCEKFAALPAELMRRLSARECRLSAAFTYFVEKAAPVSGETGVIDTAVLLSAHSSGGKLRQIIQATVPVTSLCPCSKTISAYGAHNQRSHITVAVESRVPPRVRDLFAMAEAGGSCELYSVLKRSDERHVTERAYDNPKFVEDIVRDLSILLSREEHIISYRITAENFESIHNHSACACIETDNFPFYLLS